MRACYWLVRGRVSYEIIDSCSLRTRETHSYPKGIDAHLLEALYAYQKQHPGLRFIERRHVNTPIKLSDFLNQQQLQRLELCQEYYRLLDTKYQMGMLFPAAANVRIGLAVNRSSKDFSEEERCLFNLLRRHVAQAFVRTNAAESCGSNVPNESWRRALGLTNRETEILEWVAKGKTNPEIAIILACSVWTVRAHVKRILTKLGVETRTAAAAQVWENK